MASVRVLVAMRALTGSALGLVVPVQVLVLVDRGIGPAAIGVVLAVLALTSVVAELPGGAVADVHGPRAALAIAHVLMACGVAGFAVAQDEAAFLAAAAVLGVGKALDSGALESWFVERRHADGAASPADLTAGLSSGALVHGVAVAAGAVGGGALAALAPPASGLLVGTSVPLVLSAGLLLMTAVVTLVIVREAQGRAATPRSPSARRAARVVRLSLRQVVTDPVLRRLALRGALVAAAVTLLHLALPIRLEQLLGDPEVAAAMMGGLYAGMFGLQGLGARLAPWLGTTLGPRSAVVAASLVGALCLASSAWWGVVLLTVAALLASASLGPVPPLVAPAFHAQVRRENRTGALSVAALTRTAGTATGNALLGAVVAVSFATAALVGGALLAASVIPVLGSRMGRALDGHVASRRRR